MGKYTPSPKIAPEFNAHIREAFYFLLAQAPDEMEGVEAFRDAHGKTEKLRARAEAIYRAQAPTAQRRKAEQFVPLWCIAKIMAQTLISGRTLIYVLTMSGKDVLKEARKEARKLDNANKAQKP